MLLKFIHNIQCCLVYFMFVKGWLLAFKSLIFLLSGPKQGTFKFFRKKKRAEGTLRSSICWRRQILRINEQLGWKERILHSWSLFFCILFFFFSSYFLCFSFLEMGVRNIFSLLLLKQTFLEEKCFVIVKFSHNYLRFASFVENSKGLL